MDSKLFFRSSFCLLGLWLAGTSVTQAQLTPEETAQQLQLNTITTAVPFLMIAPDSRSGALGDAGVALSADAHSIHWNPAKMAFNESQVDFSLSYAPWLRSLDDALNLA